MKDTNLYARWLKKELTEDEKSKLKASGDLEILEKIISETDSWSLPDINQNSLERLKEKIASRGDETKVILLKRNHFWMYGIAASLLMVMVSVYFIFFLDNTITYQSLAGQQLKVNLPDQTVVILNGQSSIAFDEKKFLENRSLQLKGEGYFEVTKKGKFIVHFNQGTVSVIGTKFNILSGQNIATVKCFEGKVMVSDINNKNDILIPGKGIRLINNTLNPFEFSTENPDWTKGESIFKDTPLLEVINALSIQYNINFKSDKIDIHRNYSGKFIHSDLKTALDMVFAPMGINYSIEDSKEKRSTVILN